MTIQNEIKYNILNYRKGIQLITLRNDRNMDVMFFFLILYFSDFKIITVSNGSFRKTTSLILSIISLSSIQSDWVTLNSSKCNLSIFLFLFFFLYILIRLIEYYLFLLSDNRNSQGNESSMQQNVRYSLYTQYHYNLYRSQNILLQFQLIIQCSH